MFLKELREVSAARSKEYDPQGRLKNDLSFAGLELAGETGEACNVLKKIERDRRGLAGGHSDIEHLAEELADVVICVDLIAKEFDIDLEKEIRAKFNKTSKKLGLSTKL